jgi:hypothetical protein
MQTKRRLMQKEGRMQTSKEKKKKKGDLWQNPTAKTLNRKKNNLQLQLGRSC